MPGLLNDYVKQQLIKAEAAVLLFCGIILLLMLLAIEFPIITAGRAPISISDLYSFAIFFMVILVVIPLLVFVNIYRGGGGADLIVESNQRLKWNMSAWNMVRIGAAFWFIIAVAVVSIPALSPVYQNWTIITTLTFLVGGLYALLYYVFKTLQKHTVR